MPEPSGAATIPKMKHTHSFWILASGLPPCGLLTVPGSLLGKQEAASHSKASSTHTSSKKPPWALPAPSSSPPQYLWEVMVSFAAEDIFVIVK